MSFGILGHPVLLNQKVIQFNSEGESFVTILYGGGVRKSGERLFGRHRS